MDEDWTTRLRRGSEQFEQGLRPAAAEVIRARGDRRRRRTASLSSALGVVILVGALAGYRVAIGHHGRHAAVTRSPHGLGLVAPRQYLEGVFGSVSFTIPGTGHPAEATVDLGLETGPYAAYGKPVILRQDRATGRWQIVGSVSHNGDWRGSYSVSVPAGQVVEHLLIAPAVPRTVPPPWRSGRLRISVRIGGRTVGAQAGPPAMLTWFSARWPAPDHTPIPKGTARDYLVTVRNPAGIGGRVTLSLHVGLCARPCRHAPPGIRVQWLDAGTWRTLRASAFAPGHAELLTRTMLAPYGATTVLLRVLASAHAASAAGTLVLHLTPDPSGLLRDAVWYLATSPGTQSSSGIIRIG